MNLNAKNTRLLATLLVSIIVLFQVAASVSLGHGWVTPPSVNVDVDVGSLHFRGETAEFYVLVSSPGNRVDATLGANLYYNGSFFASLSSFVQHVSTGLYRIQYLIQAS